MFERVKNWVYDFKGPFSKEGGVIDYTEAHVFINGVLYGLRNSTYDKGWQQLIEYEDGAEDEITYYHYGYVLGNRSKYVFVAGAAVYAAMTTGYI